jgi:Ribbon-helix-helix protein, copG family
MTVKRKKKRGRPATGQDPIIGLRLPKDEIARLDKWAKSNGYTRSKAIRVLIERGLPAARKSRLRPPRGFPPGS